MDTVPDQLFEDPDTITDDVADKISGTESTELLNIEPIGESPYEIFADDAGEGEEHAPKSGIPETTTPTEAQDGEAEVDIPTETEVPTETSMETPGETEEITESGIETHVETPLTETIQTEVEESTETVHDECEVVPDEIPTHITVIPTSVAELPANPAELPAQAVHFYAADKSKITFLGELLGDDDIIDEALTPSGDMPAQETRVTESNMVTSMAAASLGERFQVIPNSSQLTTETTYVTIETPQVSMDTAQTEIATDAQVDVDTSQITEQEIVEAEEMVVSTTEAAMTTAPKQARDKEMPLEEEEPMSDIITMMSADSVQTAGETAQTIELRHHNRHVDGRQQQVFAQIIEEEIIEEETVEDSRQRHNAPHYHPTTSQHQYNQTSYSQHPQHHYTTPHYTTSQVTQQEGPVCLVNKGVPNFISNIPDVCNQDTAPIYHGNNIPGYHGNNISGYHVNNIPGYQMNNSSGYQETYMPHIPGYQFTSPVYPLHTPWSAGQVMTTHITQYEGLPQPQNLPQHMTQGHVIPQHLPNQHYQQSEVRGGETVSRVKVPAIHHQSDDFITTLNPPEHYHPRRLQAREDAAKRQDQNMLISTKKIIDSTDDVLRSAHALLKSTQNGTSDSAPYKAGEEHIRREHRLVDHSDMRLKQKEKRSNYKKKKSRADFKEKEVDPDYDPDDDISDKSYLSPKDLEAAAFSSRLPADRMTKQEAISFPDIACANKEIHKHFLYIRNRLLFVWLEDPKVKLTVESATPRIEPPHNEDTELIERVYEYLYRYGFVNFGVYTSEEPAKPRPDAPKIVIVGAGVSGLTAARQLQEFGLNVEVIEARPVVGGRVCTYRDGPHIADLGAKVVTGLGGNPLAVLAKQLDLDLMPIKQDCPLYEFTGQMVPKERDERVEREFNRLLEATTYMSHQLNVNSINGRPVSLGQALEIIIKLQIRQVKEKQIKHGRERCEIQDKLNHIQQALFPLHEKIKDSHSKYLELKMKHEELSDQLGEVIRDQKAEFEVKQSYKVMLDTFSEYDSLLKEQQELEVKLTKMEQMVPNEIYMTPQERHVLDWHCANLEFANAAPLSALSLKHWDQDDDFEFTGNHLIVREGMSTIPDAMKEGLNIKFNTACVGVKYSDSGVELATREINEQNNSWATNSTQTVKCDAVLLTIPLGVLKKEKVKFEPPLPEWKTSAIKRMGFGNLNKVVLCFNKVFWDPSIHLFGHVSNSTISRGELFLFWSISKAPVLIALIAGEAATVIETVPDEAIVGRAMTILRAIFGFQTVPHPSKHRVTRWRGDAWALGSYSYVAAGSSGNDYDDLARPVAPPGATGGLPKVFFAGEHTIRNYPATVHGALLSGLREGGRITDQFFGPPYSNKTAS